MQLTVVDLQGHISTRWNLLFADVLLITVFPMMMCILFQRQIVSGMTAGAIKG